MAVQDYSAAVRDLEALCSTQGGACAATAGHLPTAEPDGIPFCSSSVQMCVVADWLLLLLHSGFTSRSVKDLISANASSQAVGNATTATLLLDASSLTVRDFAFRCVVVD